ncbi:LysM peptidoglycan-binding domain-containing protein [Elizabethkingia argentiflava]|uniref:LysM peptidoglycan-binding domain-containing protein n=1 Tax=Elizabethkingia argenteiflava TaxID=2681556 RepID=A0A845Q089_9FLAO|nr:LysM peptidoglycan-binding domain-containing protein [Elizabethkingia argenteiflava]NAW52038.1 LysM peptidoglycan-binding domain-containing protein [Elizabethkingia argenteiflava]
MKKTIILALSIFGFSVSAQKTHEVSAKETPYSISRKYGLTLEEFYNLNPKIKDGGILGIGDSVVISKASNISDKSPVNPAIGQVSVQPRQSLYALSREYQISVAEIRSLNPEIGESLQIGQKINLPLENIKKYIPPKVVSQTPAPSPSLEQEDTPVVPVQNKSGIYMVQPKDTYQTIIKNFNMSLSELFRINPGLEKEGLQPGVYIVVARNNPAISAPTEKVRQKDFTPREKTQKKEIKAFDIADDGTNYTVQPGDTIFGILNKFGISLDQLIELNPSLATGLKAGMVIRIKGSSDKTSFIKSSGDALNIVLLLPFGFDAKDAKYRTAALDFLTGAKLAIQRSIEKGQKLNINIIDEGSEASFKKVLTSVNRDNTDLIIGPFFKSDLEALMSYVSSKKIPVISPFANAKDLYKYDNLIIVETEASVYAERIAKEVSTAYNGEKIYIVGSGQSYAGAIQAMLEKSLGHPNISVLKNAGDIKIESNIVTGQPAPIITILASDNEGEKTNFVNTMINLGKEAPGTRSFSMFYSTDFEKKEDELGNVKLVYIMDRKINTQGEFEREVLKQYTSKFCKSPSKYAVVGFDIMIDALSRENAKGEIFNKMGKVQTHLATKFEYEKTKEGAYINKGYRLVRLNP